MSCNKIQIVCDGRLEYFRKVELGVRNYGFSTGNFVFADRWLPEDLRNAKRLAKLQGIDGIIALIGDRKVARRFAQIGVPVVNVSNSIGDRLFPLVTQDDEMVGEIAARHLLERGCASLAFWGEPGISYSDQRQKGFLKYARTHPSNCPVSCNGSRVGAPYLETVDRMTLWLRPLPRPVGVFATLDTLALLVMRAAREEKWHVPDEIAVLGAGDDDFWVEHDSVPLSSIRLPSRKIGYAAGEMLHQLLSHRALPIHSTRLPVSEIAERQSTDRRKVVDPAVARAIAFIEQHACRNPYLEEIARAAGISRSSLQKRFQFQFKCSPLEEVRRVRIRRAQEFLRRTNVKMDVVAERTGFPNSQAFSVQFRNLTALTPMGYRRQFT